MLILPDQYRFRIENRMGAQIDFSTDGGNNTFTMEGMSWNISSTGVLTYSTEFSLFNDPSADLADLAAAEGIQIDNAASNGGLTLGMGLFVVATLTTDVAVAGRIDIYFEWATDTGTVFPSDAADLVEDEDMILIRSIIHPGGGAGAPDTKRVNLSI